MIQLSVTGLIHCFIFVPLYRSTSELSGVKRLLGVEITNES
ncbi:hypothetical protein HMPREF3034_00062 [Prevotella sp. DNF00663]|nr:hypothetical protein HMPREF3034_00062 [Prevotella sp. DNF00663]